GQLVEAGDYSGFGGAGKALEQAADVAVLETARGGILLRGIGTAHNDVAVVTNVTSDHIGLLGIKTLDQLAEVKAAITRITRPDGWDVLNADDPRVLAMRRTSRGRPWLFSIDPDHPAVRAAVDEGGRGMTVIDGYLTALLPGRSRRLVAIEQVPMTLAGISRHNIQNAMAGAGAGVGGARDVPVFIDELRAVEWMLDRARPGDVVAITPLIQRTEIFALMDERGATRVGPDRLRRLVRRARTGR